MINKRKALNFQFSQRIKLQRYCFNTYLVYKKNKQQSLLIKGARPPLDFKFYNLIWDIQGACDMVFHAQNLQFGPASLSF